MRFVSALLFLPLCLGQGPGCGSMGPCGYRQPPPSYQQLPQPLQQPLPQPQYQTAQQQYYYGYAQPPPMTLMSQDKDLTTVHPSQTRLTEYDKFEEKLGQLKPITVPTIVEPPPNITAGTTYIRELPYPPQPYPAQPYPKSPYSVEPYPAQPYAPQPYPSRPMPYRPHPMGGIRGCPVPPQYIRPAPYMPRGYVTPLPYAPQPLPPLMPLPTLPPLQPLVLPAPAPLSSYPFPPPNNDCCGRCAAPCKFKQRRHAHAQASKTEEGFQKSRRDLPSKDSTAKDPRCSNEKLRDIMNKSTTRTAAMSKRLIQKAAEEEMGGFFSVFCSTDDFSYLARSETFCQTSKNNIVCYAFQHN